LRAEFLTGHDRAHATVDELQAAVDAWVVEYNSDRPHQSCGGRPPVERFALAEKSITAAQPEVATHRARSNPSPGRPGGVSRWVNGRGRISLGGFDYPVGATFAGEPVEVVVTGGLVEVLHAGALVATHVQRVKEDQKDRVARVRVPQQRRARDATTGLTVTRLTDAAGTLSFAGTPYTCGRRRARQAIEVSIVAGSVQLTKDGQVIRVHPIRHDRSRELGAFANPKGRPRRQQPA
jgi:hypothetical protein